MPHPSWTAPILPGMPYPAQALSLFWFLYLLLPTSRVQDLNPDSTGDPGL